MKPFLSSTAPLPSPSPRVKAIRPVFSACEPPESCPTIATIRPRGGQYQPQTLPCSRFPQTYGPPSSGGWIGLRCRQTSVRTTTSGCGSTSTFATNTEFLQPPPRAWAPFSPSSHPKTSRWARGDRPPLLFGSSTRRYRSPPERPCEPGPVHYDPQGPRRSSRPRRHPRNGEFPS